MQLTSPRKGRECAMKSISLATGIAFLFVTACNGSLQGGVTNGDGGTPIRPDGEVIRIDGGPRDGMVFSGDGACVAPDPIAPIVYLPCDDVPAESSCVAGTVYEPALRWSFDPSMPMADTSSAAARPVGSGLDAVADSSAVGGGYAYVHAPSGLVRTTGSAEIINSSAATIEMLVRFGHPVDWSGLPGWGTGNRTDLFDFGGASIHYSREDISVGGDGERAEFAMSGGGVATWAHIGDGAWHHLAVVLSNGGGGLNVSLWIDGESPPEFTATTTGTLGALTRIQEGFYETSGIDIDELSIYDQVLPPTFIAQRAREALAGTRPADTDRCEARQCTRPARDVGIVGQLFEPGFDAIHPYAPTMGTEEQITQAPLPRHKRGHTMPRVLALWTHGQWSVATENPVYYSHPNSPDDTLPTSTQRENDAIRAREALDLATRWNYSVNGALTGDGESHPDENPYTAFLRSAPDSWPFEGMCGMANEDEVGLSLVDAAGDFVGFSPAGSLATYEQFGYDQCAGNRSEYEALVGHKLDLLELDIEGPSYSVFQTVGTSRWDEIKDLPANAATKAYCDGLGLPWRECLARGVSDIHNAIADGARRDIANPPAVHVYSISGNENYDGDYRYTRMQNEPVPATIDPLSDGSDRFRYSTPYIYPSSAFRWYYTIADRRGLSWLLDARQAEIDAGSPWAMPYVAPGWAYMEEKNIRPPQWLGMLKVMGVAGALTYVPGFFIIPRERGGSCSWGVCNDLVCADGDVECTQQTIQNPNHHAWQHLIPSYAQGIVSRGEDILRSASSQWLGTLTTNNPAIAATGTRLGSRVLIAVALMPNSNDGAAYQVTSSTAIVGIDHDGNTGTALRDLHLDARVQGNVYVADFSTTPATVIQLDAWHEETHPNWWSNDLMFDAEVFDAANDMEIHSEAPGAASDDFRGLTGYVRVAASRAAETFEGSLASAPTIEVDLEPRADTTYQVWARVRTSSATPASVYVWADSDVGSAQQAGCAATGGWAWVRLNCAADGVASTLALSGDVSHVIYVAPSHGGVEIDRVILTTDTACIDDAPSCTCM